MKTVSIDEIKEHFSDYLQQSQDEPILITENGRPIAAITIVVDPDELERMALANNPEFNQLLAAADRSIEETGGIKHEDFWQLVENS